MPVWVLVNAQQAIARSGGDTKMGAYADAGITIAVIVLIIAGIIHAPIWCVLLNPFVFQLVGFLFRASKLDIFIDAPSCCAASMGLASYGLLALLCL